MKSNQKSLRNLRQEKHAYTQLVTGLISFFLILGIGIMIYYKINDSYTIDNSAGAAAKNNTTSMFNTVINFMPIIGLVTVAGIIIYIINGGFGTSKSKKGGL